MLLLAAGVVGGSTATVASVMTPLEAAVFGMLGYVAGVNTSVIECRAVEAK